MYSAHTFVHLDLFLLYSSLHDAPVNMAINVFNYKVTEPPFSLIDRSTGWWPSGSALYNVVTTEGRWSPGGTLANGMRPVRGREGGVRGGEDVSNHYRDDRTRICGLSELQCGRESPLTPISDKLVCQCEAHSQPPRCLTSARLGPAWLGSAALTRTESSRRARAPIAHSSLRAALRWRAPLTTDQPSSIHLKLGHFRF